MSKIEKLDLSWLTNIDEEIESPKLDYRSFRISPEDKIEKPTPILSFKQSNGYLLDVLTEENISMIQGQAKSRKSALIKSICEGIIKGNNIMSSQYDRKRIAIFDTEQSSYDCYRAVTGIKQMTGGVVDYFSVAEINSKDKVHLVEAYLEENPNCGFLILDNIVHFLNNFNDVEESTSLTNWLIKTKKDYNVHILNILHENDGDGGKARGHLGSLLKNLCETIIKVAKDKSNPTRSIVSPHATRGGDFEEFAIEMDNNRIPHIYPLDGGYSNKPTRY